MTGLEAAVLYAGLMVLLFMGLKLNCGITRARSQVMLGDGGNETLQKAMRMQANAGEDVPITMVAILALAVLGAPAVWIHSLGASLVVLRLLHALGMGGVPGLGIGRMIGTFGTLIVMLVTAGACLWFALGQG